MNYENRKLKFFGEILGMSPFSEKIKQAAITFFGEEDIPSSKIGLSSLKQLYPRISHKLWRRKFIIDRKVIISNLFNHTPTPIEKGWSVAKTQTKDFRGRQLTYNSHNGTDFAIPVGSKVCTAAPGVVVAIQSQFNRGGLKIFIDHGDGLMTCYAHLARSLVNEGDILDRGHIIALSGYSGIDGMMTFPFGIPHIHFNVWHNSLPTDPFPFENHASLWRNGETPHPHNQITENQFTPSTYKEETVNYIIDNCKTEKVKIHLRGISCEQKKATLTMIEMNYYPTRFKTIENLYQREYERLPVLDLPFLLEDFDGVVFLDDYFESKKKNIKLN
jgi:hypothetical protein